MPGAPSHRLRFVAGLALAALVAAWMAHRFVDQARRHVAYAAEERRAVVALQAVASLVQRAGSDADAARRLVQSWQKQSPYVAQVRVVRGMQLDVSTVPADTGDKAAPRRLAREEKPLYDLAQRLASAVQTNREEGGARKAEIELQPLDGRLLSLAMPLELDGNVTGAVELVTGPLAVAPETPWLPYTLPLLIAVLAFAGLAFALRAAGERRWVLGVVAVLAFLTGLHFVGQSAATVLNEDGQRAITAVGERVREQTAVVQAVAASEPLPPAPAGTPSDWDTDFFRKPRAELGPGGAVDPGRLANTLAANIVPLQRSLLALMAVAITLLLLTGLGAFHAFGRTVRKNRQAYLYIAPAILGMLALVFYPFSYGITLSFTDSNIYNTNESIGDLWVGFRNYASILGDFNVRKATEAGSVWNYQNFYWTLMVTVVWTVTNVAYGVTSGLILALVLNTKGLALRPIYRVLLILPWAVPNYITSLIWKGMFHQQFGVINQGLQLFGGGPVNWFEHPVTSFLTALTTNGWLSTPFMMVVSLGALQSIPADLYEAARVDGASRWQQFTAITLPSLRPALIPAVILSVVWTFNMFNVIYLVTAGEPGGATEILVTQAYKFAFERYRYGYAAAYSTVIFMILLVYGVFQNRYSKATEA